MAQHGHKITEKIKHFLHHDKHQVTTPDGSPGYANVKTVPTTTTTNIPEAFSPASKSVVPEETHSTDPYSSALEQHQVPTDPAAMMGAPHSEKDSKAAPPDESTSVAEEEQQMDATPPTTPVSEDTGLNLSSEAQEQTTGEAEGIVAPSELPTTEADTKDYPPHTESSVQTKGEGIVTPSELSTTDADTKDYPPGPKSSVQTTGIESDMQIEDIPDDEAQMQTEDYPVTDSVVERKDMNPGTDSLVERKDVNPGTV